MDFSCDIMVAEYVEQARTAFVQENRNTVMKFCGALASMQICAAGIFAS
jgi:hypothetical protein